MRKMYLKLAIVWILLAMLVPFTKAQTTIFNETFGQHTTRVTCPYTATGANSFTFADPSTTDDPSTTSCNWPLTYCSNERTWANEIENNYYAVVAPKNIYTTFGAGYTPSGYQLWGSNTASLVDHTGDTDGAVMVVNAGTTLSSLYKRSVSLTSGNYYRLTYWVYGVNASANLAAELFSPSGNTVLRSDVSNIGTTGAWTQVTVNYSLATGCIPATNTYFISIKNNSSQTGGYDYFVDDIKFEDMGTSGSGNAVSCPAAEPTTTNDTNTGSPVATTINFSILTNDKLADGTTTATTSNSTFNVLVPAGGIKDAFSNKITVPGEGDWTWNTSTGVLTFTAASGFTGNPSPIQYTITETASSQTSAPATVTILYAGTPTVTNDAATQNIGQPVTLNILTNDHLSTNATPTPTEITTGKIRFHDSFGSIVTGTSFTVPGEGTWSYNLSTGALTFTPQTGFVGTPSVIQYQIQEGSNWSAPADVTITVNTPCAWRSQGAGGDWATASIWEYKDCTSNTWIDSPVAPNNDGPVYISDGTTVTVPSSVTVINADSLVIESTGKLVVSNPITINSPLVFEINQSGGAGQLLGACGNVTMGPSSKLIARKTLDNTWDFISFPFAVANIYLANTTTTADWGDLSSNLVDGKEFIVAEYDAQARANAGTISTNSTYFKSVSPHTFTAQKGYIITGGAGLTGINPNPSTITLDFVSAVGASLGFCDVTNAGTLSYITGTACASGEGWNLVGTPYTAAYNLYYASTTASPALKPYYVYNGSTYTTVITTPANDYAINPFSAFFLQTTAANQALNYDDAGLTNLTSHTVGSSSAPALRASIMLSQNVNTDVTAINLDENAATEYVKGEDVVRMSNSSSTAPQIYTEAEGACSALSINTLPMNTNKVNLKVKFGKLGLNTIKLINAEKAIGFNAVTLVDTETTIQTDLLKDSYSFENTATGETGRFYILLSQTANTGLNEFSNDNIKAIVIGNEIQLTGIDGRARVNIYDLVGKTMGVYQSVNNNESIRINKQGIYFIDVLSDSQHSTVKVIIK